MANLLLFEQQQAIKAISRNNQDDYVQIANEVEDVELRDLIGTELLQDLQDNPTDPLNVKLLDPTEFENAYGNLVKHKGIRYVLAYFNYANYVGISNIKDTFTGFVKKVRQESESIGEGTTRRLIDDNRKIALRAFELINEYLCLNAIDYPMYRRSRRQNIFVPKISAPKKTHYRKVYSSTGRKRI